jgi:hypothetical protein
MKTIRILVGIAIANILVIYLFSVVAYIYLGKQAAKAQADSGQIITPLEQSVPTTAVATIAATVTKATTSKTPKTTPKAVPTKKEDTSAPTPTPDTRCIIVIDGAQYNVTQLRSTHSGGDIFTCQTDMSAIFWSRHNQDIFQKLQKYRI